jgi:hypothetical protein
MFVERLEIGQRSRSMSPPMLPFREAQCHPRLEARMTRWMHVRMRRQVVIEAVGHAVVSACSQSGLCAYICCSVTGSDEQFHPQVLPDRTFAFGFREPSHRIDVIRLDAVEVVLGLARTPAPKTASASDLPRTCAMPQSSR